MTDLEQINAKLDMILSQLEALRPAPERPMSQVAFAKRVGLSRWTIARRIAEGFVRTKGGKIPPSELKKFGL